MLKFQNNNTTVIATFEDFISTVYVIIDDLYHQFAPPEVINRRHVLDARLSDSEIIKVSICGELAGIDSENAWFSFEKGITVIFSRNFAAGAALTEQDARFCKFGRARYCHFFRGYGADYGKCPSKKETYFGYKVHTLITLEGYITAFEITPASADDREGLRDIVEGQSNIVILSDKGYVGERFTQEMAQKGIFLMALKRSNSKTDFPKPVRQLIFKLRRRVETVFSQLSDSIFHETCELGKIKQLIF